MCVNTRLVRNKWTGKTLRVSCGRCEACRQEKAIARANRIRNHSKFGFVPLFVTLTYKNDFLPYVRRSDFYDDSLRLPIYRNKSVRQFLDHDVINDKLSVLDSPFLGDDPLDYAGVPSPSKMDHDCIGVIYYPDVQNFFKRLRINLQRKYGYHKTFSYFCCAEYGSHSKRPHFHLLLFCPVDDVEIISAAIVESWPFADRVRTKNYIEIAKNAASYVASYVNCSNSFPSFLQKDVFKQKHSYSKNFGVGLRCFSLPALLEKVERRNMCYNVQKVENGVPCIASVPIPEYIISRYFPKFKGYSLFTDDEVRKLSLLPEKLAAICKSRNPLIVWSDSDIFKYRVRLNHLIDVFKSELGWSEDEFVCNYGFYLVDIWSCLRNTKFRMSYDIVKDKKDWYSFYENNNELLEGVVCSDFVDTLGLDDVSRFVLNPNERLDVVNSTVRLREIFYKMDKNKRIVNFAMSHSGHLV